MDKIVSVWDSNFEVYLTIDDYYSLIWTIRHSKEGDFILELPVKYVGLVILGCYLTIDGDNHFMVVEKIRSERTEDGTRKLTLSGPSGESILRRRSEPLVTVANGQPNVIVSTLISNHFITPADTKRAIPNMTQITSGPFATLKEVYDPAPIYDIVVAICESEWLGFEVLLVKETAAITFRLYKGVDRSYGQSVVPVVVFSEEYDNVISENDFSTMGSYYNVVIMANNDPTLTNKVYWSTPEAEGLSRRELIVDAQNIVDASAGWSAFVRAQYVSGRAYDVLSNSVPVGASDGQLDIRGIFKYGQDFMLGDIVEFSSLMRSTTAQAVEYVISVSQEGVREHVSFLFDV